MLRTPFSTNGSITHIINAAPSCRDERRETMAINYEILGEPGRDNALLVTVDSGQSQRSRSRPEAVNVE